MSDGNTPFFSIIIPTYNRCYCIGNAIQSVIDQTFNDWELIIIDDGSTDNTKSVVESFSDSRIKYFWQENNERCAARNNGIRKAIGEWVCFQDSDDEYLSNHFEVLHQSIVENIDFRVFRTGLIFQEAPIPIYPKCPKLSCLPFSGITTFVFHKSLITMNKFNESYNIGEDILFIYKICIKNKLKIIEKYSVKCNGFNKLRGNYQFQKLILNKIDCFTEIIKLSYNNSNNLPFYYFHKEILISNLYGLYLSLLKKKINIIFLRNSLKFIFLNPVISLQTILRIIYVTIAESLGFEFDGSCRF